MLFKLPARIHGEASVRVVCVPSAFARSAARPVLDHRDHAVFTPAVRAAFRCLHPVAVGLHHRDYLFRIAAEGILQPHPPGFCGQVDLRPEGCRDSEGPVFLRRHLCEPAYQFRIAGSSQADTFRPLAHVAARRAEFRAEGGNPVPGIRGDVHRDAPGFLLAGLLQVVAPLRRYPGALHTHLQHVADMVLLQQAHLPVGQVRVMMLCRIERLPAVRIPERSAPGKGNHLVRGVQHQPGHFLPAQPGCQVRRPGLRVQPPVLIGQQFARPCQVLEGISVLFDHRNVPGDAQVFPAFVADQRAVYGVFTGPAQSVFSLRSI